MGSVAGNTWTHNMKRLILTPSEFNDSGPDYTVRLTGSPNSSDGAATDEAQLVLT